MESMEEDVAEPFTSINLPSYCIGNRKNNSNLFFIDSQLECQAAGSTLNMFYIFNPGTQIVPIGTKWSFSPYS